MEKTKAILPVNAELKPLCGTGGKIAGYVLRLHSPLADDGAAVEKRLREVTGKQYLLVVERRIRTGQWEYIFEYNWKGD